MNANPTPAPPHGRFSLLTGPWHTSSRVVAALVLVFLVFCNVPGQEVARLRFGNLPPIVADIAIETRLEHGWPLTFIDRPSMTPRALYGPGLTTADCFALWRDVDAFYWAALVLNGIVVLSAGWLLGLSFEAWRRARNRLSQIHVRDLLALLLIVSGIGAWFLNERQEYAAADRILHRQWPSGEAPAPDLDCTYQDGGVTWLRLVLGDGPFEQLDRPFSVTVGEREGWPQLAQLPSTRRVESIVAGTTEELKSLGNLPDLEALSLQQFDRNQADNLELPALLQLRGLQLWGIEGTCRGIERASALEVLTIDRASVDDQTFQEIRSLAKLRELSLAGLECSAGRLAALSALPSLHALEVAQTHLDASALQSLGQFPDLTYLAIRDCEIAGGNFHELSALQKLKTLDLTGAQPVTSRDIAPLTELPKLRELYLAGTLVDRDAIEHLAKFQQLRLLALPRRGFSEADEKLLRQSLPRCEIHFER